MKREISIKDVLTCISDGEIINQYEDIKPFPSCLILGYRGISRPLHVVISFDDEFIHLITAYVPDKDRWENDFKTKKEK